MQRIMQRIKKWAVALIAGLMVFSAAIPAAGSDGNGYYAEESGGLGQALWNMFNLQDWQDFMDSERTVRDFRNFLRADLGQVLIFIFAGAFFFTVSIIFLKRAKFSMTVLTYAGSAMALAFMLSYITFFSMGQGGSVTPMSMFVVSLIGFWFGPVIGITAGVTYGFLQLIQGAHMINPVQLLLDYPLAFGMLGLSGFFRNMKWGMYIGFVVGALGRFVMSTAAGYFYWLAGTPGALWGSITYNGSYVFPEIILTFVLLAIPALRNAIAHVTERAIASQRNTPVAADTGWS